MEKAFSNVGVDLDSVIFSGYASSMAVLSETEKELGVILVDIGAGTTDISIYVEGSVAYSSVVPIGARHITNDLAIGLRISLESAEKIKLFLSRPPKAPKVTDEESEEKVKERFSDEIDLSALALAEELKKVSKKTLIDGIIRPRLNELFTMVSIEIKKSGFAGQTPSGLVLTGGGAKTVGSIDSAKRVLAMPVRVAIANNIKGIIDEIQEPSYSAVIGLTMYGSNVESDSKLPFGFGLPRMGNVKFDNKLVSKFFNFIKSFLP
jgi:cell division protein FtsA